jgi:hypothetical protein
LASLPHRTSPNYKKRSLSTSQPSQPSPISPTFADITPAGSDSEDVPQINEPRSFFSPWSSPLDESMITSSRPSSILGSSQTTASQNSATYSDDLEMIDSSFLHPGTFHADSSNNIASRIPTPITSQFSLHIRSADKAPSYLRNSTNNFGNYSFDEERADQNLGGRRLPSPISEDEPSPSTILEGFSDVQMEEENVSEEPNSSPPKKGHSRSKHSLRSWGGAGSDVGGIGVRRGFSMGYRSDCEKCRMKVPGHVSHIITY